MNSCPLLAREEMKEEKKKKRRRYEVGGGTRSCTACIPSLSFLRVHTVSFFFFFFFNINNIHSFSVCRFDFCYRPLQPIFHPICKRYEPDTDGDRFIPKYHHGLDGYRCVSASTDILNHECSSICMGL